jgi:hypothetical protein
MKGLFTDKRLNHVPHVGEKNLGMIVLSPFEKGIQQLDSL